MGVDTKIQWAHHTFNPWIGCTKVDEACRNCYAEAQNAFRKWNGGTWGPGAPRKRTSDANWNRVRAWNREAEAAGERRRVFCASLADVFDQEAPHQARQDLWFLIDLCPALDWLLLTKRPENARRMLPAEWLAKPRPNVWIGTSVGDQRGADERIPHLLKTPAAVRFLSCEPLLGPVDLTHLNAGPFGALDALRGGSWGWPGAKDFVNHSDLGGGVRWLIAGGESGPGARPMRIEWARDLVNQCRDAGVPVFFKQTGVAPQMAEELWRAGPRTPLLNHRAHGKVPEGLVQLAVPDKHGGIPEAWPGGADAWPREFPEVRNGR